MPSPDAARRSLLPALMIALAAIGVGALGFRSAWQETAVARDRAHGDLEAALRVAGGVLREAQDRLRDAGPGVRQARFDAAGRGLEPAEPREAPPLLPNRLADREGGFYLDQGERFAAAGDDEEATRLHRVATRPGRHPSIRALAWMRLAAVARRSGDAARAREAQAKALVAAEGPARRTRDLLLARHLDAPEDPALIEDLLAVIGSADDALARAMLPPSAADALSERDAAVASLRRLREFLPAAGAPAVESFLLRGDALVRVAPVGEGGWLVSSTAKPPLPAEVTLASVGEEVPEAGFLVRRSDAPPGLPDHRLVARRDADAVAQDGRAQAAWTLAAVALLFIGGVTAVLALRRALRREREAITARSEFLAQVGHDLRTPLAVIRMYAETLADPRGLAPEESREFAGVMVSEATRLSSLVDTVLDFGRLEGRGGHLPASPLDLRALVQETLEAHTPLLAEAGMALETSGLEKPVFVLGDAAALRGVFGNLIENVMNHAASGKLLQVSVASAEDTVSLTVRDRGPGLPEGWQTRIFDRYVRGPEPRTRGTGLGLALVRETVEAMGGGIVAANHPEGGATFTVELPRSDPR